MSTPKPPLSREHLLEKFLRDADDYWFHAYRPRRGDVVVDIGAGRGEDVYAFSRAIGEEGRIWAIEAHPDTFAALTAFCAEHRLNNVTTLNLACMDRPGQLQIETLPTWESNFVREGPPSPSSHPVEGITFDALCRRHSIDRIDYLKMNIEGAELTALPGCRDALKRARACTIAAHDFRADRGEGDQFRTLAFVKQFLLDSGFDLIIREDDPRYYVPYHVHGLRPTQ